MIRVVVVDDQQLIRVGLRMLCTATEDIEVVGEAEDGREAIELAHRLLPDVVLMDLHMPGVDGITATQRILAARPSIRIVVLTTFDDDSHLFPALKAGACGFLAKDTAPEELLAGIRRAAVGETPFSPDVLRRVVDRAITVDEPEPGPAIPAELTAREREVLDLVATGMSNTEISAALFISVTTVKTHITNLMTKTASRNRVHLAVNAHQFG